MERLESTGLPLGIMPPDVLEMVGKGYEERRVMVGEGDLPSPNILPRSRVSRTCVDKPLTPRPPGNIFPRALTHPSPELNRGGHSERPEANVMAEDGERYGRHRRLRAAAPQALTGARVALGAAAVIASLDGLLYTAAALITAGAVTDILDGLLARRLNVASAFGALFDTFSDYLCFVVAPWVLTRTLVDAAGSVAHEAAVGLPLLTGAVRYARNSLLIVARGREVRELPGLATVFFAFLPVAAVFLDARSLVGGHVLSAVLTFFVVIFSLLMIAPVRYPKLTRARGASAAVLAPLVVMPFFGTRVLACVMVIVGLLYVALAHLLARGPGPDAADFTGGGRGVDTPPLP